MASVAEIRQLGRVQRAITRYPGPTYLILFGLLNLAPAALMLGLWAEGWLGIVFEADNTGITILIILVFIAGLVLCTQRLWRLDSEIACVRSYDPCQNTWVSQYLYDIGGRSAGSRAIFGNALQLKVSERIGIVKHIAHALILLGLIGTVVGFIIALSGVDPESASNIDAVSPMVAELIRGMSVALYTTLAGAVCNLWLSANYRLLTAAATTLVTELVALGEANART